MKTSQDGGFVVNEGKEDRESEAEVADETDSGKE